MSKITVPTVQCDNCKKLEDNAYDLRAWWELTALSGENKPTTNHYDLCGGCWSNIRGELRT